MKILMTNNTLDTRSGSEMYTKEVAEKLLQRGHVVAAYSDTLGPVAESMRSGGIEVVDDLAKLSFVPDIIHGQHHLETMTALAFFSAAPAIYIAHGWRPWQEAAPLHPRIMEYAAVDSKTFDVSMKENGVPKDRIRLIHNFANLDRFKRRSPLPEKPKRALIFNNTADERGYISVIRWACKRAGVTLDIVGISYGNATDHPEDIFGNYDIVFAVGKSAIEALVSGCSVVICNDFGIGPMVNSADFDRLRDGNFGVAVMYGNTDTESVYREIMRYDASDAGEVTERLRNAAGIDEAIDVLERLYADAFDRYSKCDVIDTGDEIKAFSRYIRTIAAILKRKDSDVHMLSKQSYEMSKHGSIIQLRMEIDAMKASKFWKLREKYMAFKSLIFRI